MEIVLLFCLLLSLQGKKPSGLEHFHFENALTDDGASLVRANEE